LDQSHRRCRRALPLDYVEVMKITFVQGDITEQDVDAIVNAANHTLLGGGGVDGAIHRRGGPEILSECQKLREDQYPHGLPTGQAVATNAGRLKARWVIHTVGPTYAKSKDKSQLLADCFRNSLRIADELGAATVAFPAISTGVYRWPVDDTARIALNTVRSSETRVDEARFVLFDQLSYDAFIAQASSSEG
jgi:O-acetyl-ADP-ribose deacetylase (regulator of RNase III)